MVTHGNQTNCGDHFEIYRNIESECCVPGTNTALQVNHASKTNEQANSHKKRSDLWLPEVKFGGQGSWMKAV